MKKPQFIAYLSLILMSSLALGDGGGVSTLGLCKKTVPRDRVSILFTAVQQSPSSKEANVQALKKYESFRKGVSDLKLKNFEAQTTDMSLSPKMEWVNGKNVNRGYEARASLMVTTSSMERVGELYDLAAKVAIKEFGSLRMFVSSDVHDAAYKECLKVALRDAQSKAQEIAAAANKKLGGLKYAAESNAASIQPPMPMAKSFGGAEMAHDMAASIEAGSSDIEVRVLATFEIK